MNEQKYIVVFENNKGENIVVGQASNYDDAWQIMREHISKIGFKCYYVRTTQTDYGEWIDYGSHSQFFKFVKPEMLDKVLNGDE